MAHNKIINLGDQETSMDGLQGLQNYSSYLWGWTVSTVNTFLSQLHILQAARIASQEKLGGALEGGCGASMRGFRACRARATCEVSWQFH